MYGIDEVLSNAALLENKVAAYKKAVVEKKDTTELANDVFKIASRFEISSRSVDGFLVSLAEKINQEK